MNFVYKKKISILNYLYCFPISYHASFLWFWLSPQIYTNYLINPCFNKESIIDIPLHLMYSWYSSNDISLNYTRVLLSIFFLVTVQIYLNFNCIVLMWQLVYCHALLFIFFLVTVQIHPNFSCFVLMWQFMPCWMISKIVFRS